MKQLLRVVIATITVFFLALSLSAQVTSAYQWTWMKGANTVDQTGNYGTVNVAAATNTPGAREFTSNWTDATGVFWMFGGNGYDGTGLYGYMADLWKYDPTTNNWTWVKGGKVSNKKGVYGTQGTAAAANKPGTRELAASWTDATGKMWLFGGQGYDGTTGVGDLNDLWKYDPATNNWTWMKGSSAAAQSGTYGTKGTAAAANTPGAREGAFTWADAAGNLWLFGGYGYDAASGFSDWLNDLWKYNIAANQWTWMSGSNVSAQSGIYGTQGTPSATTVPGGRETGAAFLDSKGKLFLFGGYGYDSGTGFSDYLNDVWKYDPVSNQWTWVNGSNTSYQTGVYGTQGVASATNQPGSRDEMAMWTDAFGNFWIFGGEGLDGAGTSEDLADLWKYDPTTNQWTWVKGSSTAASIGVYGTQGVQAAANTPGSRDGRQVGFVDLSGNFWLFSGDGYALTTTEDLLNDLWKLSPVVLPVTLTSVKAYQASSNINVEWTFSQEINMSRYVIEKSATGTSFIDAATVISTGNHSSFITYNWVDIHPNNGANYYRIRMVGKDGNITYSQVVKVVTGSGSIISVYPNPVTGSSFALQFQNQAVGNFNINLINAAGQVVYKTTINSASGNSTQTIQLPLVLSKGIYSLQIITPDKSVNNQKLVIN